MFGSQSYISEVDSFRGLGSQSTGAMHGNSYQNSAQWSNGYSASPLHMEYMYDPVLPNRAIRVPSPPIPNRASLSSLFNMQSNRSSLPNRNYNSNTFQNFNPSWQGGSQAIAYSSPSTDTAYGAVSHHNYDNGHQQYRRSDPQPFTSKVAPQAFTSKFQRTKPKPFLQGQPLYPRYTPAAPLVKQWTCRLCDCTMPVSTKQDHLNGKKHQSKLQTDMMCNICDMKIAAQNFEEHMNGKRHQKQVEKRSKSTSNSTSSHPADKGPAWNIRPNRANITTPLIRSTPIAPSIEHQQQPPAPAQQQQGPAFSTGPSAVSSASAPNTAAMIASQFNTFTPAQLDKLRASALRKLKLAFKEASRREGEESERNRRQVQLSLEEEVKPIHATLEAELQAARDKFNIALKACKDKWAQEEKRLAASHEVAFRVFQEAHEEAHARLRDVYARDVAALSQGTDIAFPSDVERILNELNQAKTLLYQTYRLGTYSSFEAPLNQGSKKRPFASVGDSNGEVAGKPAMLLLHEMCKKNLKPAPVYQTTSEFTPERDGLYRVTVFIDSVQYGQGEHLQSRIAQHLAANATLLHLWDIKGSIPTPKPPNKRLKWGSFGGSQTAPDTESQQQAAVESSHADQNGTAAGVPSHEEQTTPIGAGSNDNADVPSYEEQSTPADTATGKFGEEDSREQGLPPYEEQRSPVGTEEHYHQQENSAPADAVGYSHEEHPAHVSQGAPAHEEQNTSAGAVQYDQQGQYNMY